MVALIGTPATKLMSAKGIGLGAGSSFVSCRTFPCGNLRTPGGWPGFLIVAAPQITGGCSIMALTFYYGSGSPFAWKVWLTLEHKAIPYDFKLLSFDRGDTKKPEYLAVNPRGQVPTIVDDGFALWESTAITEYL